MVSDVGKPKRLYSTVRQRRSDSANNKSFRPTKNNRNAPSLLLLLLLLSSSLLLLFSLIALSLSKSFSKFTLPSRRPPSNSSSTFSSSYLSTTINMIVFTHLSPLLPQRALQPLEGMPMANALPIPKSPTPMRAPRTPLLLLPPLLPDLRILRTPVTPEGMEIALRTFLFEKKDPTLNLWRRVRLCG